jgi:Domain of Unknown Function with PDB structure (DUF3857)
MRNSVLLFVLALPFALQGQQYNVNLIADSLKMNANMVKRYDEISIEIKSPGKATMRKRHVYSILNEYGKRYSRYSGYYNKFVSINNISGVLFDEMGKEVKRAKKKDMQDLSGSDEETLMTDTRYKQNDFYYNNYPYTTDYEEEDEINGILYFPDWNPINASGISVEDSKYVIIAPKDYLVRYKEIAYDKPPQIQEVGDKKIYTWEIRNIPARSREILAPEWSELVPHVMMAPSDFEAQGYKGNMSTWENYGRFLGDLMKGRDILPDNIKHKVHELTDHLDNSRQKVYVLYDYLQKNTRYISIQLGIGGFQPFDATEVAVKRYGDCKALSNFMVALLKEAGIKGNSVIIRGGEDAIPIEQDFPSQQFNHVISCVPLQKDTLWMECTSQTIAAGYLSGFTADRFALLVDDTGGKLIRTPKYGINDNVQIRKIVATLSEEGNLNASRNTRYEALQQDDIEELISVLSKDRLMEYLKTEIDLPTYDVTKFEYKQEKTGLPYIDEFLELNATSYAQVSGKRLFINPNITTREITKLRSEEQRKYDVELNDEFKDIDTAEIRIPTGYQPESIPRDLNIETKFGKYRSTTKVLSDKIIYYRTHEQYSGRFPASDFANLAKFYDQMYKADHSMVVLVKQP